MATPTFSVHAPAGAQASNPLGLVRLDHLQVCGSLEALEPLCRRLGFSRADRDENILRIGYVASEVVRHRGIAICAAISPFREARERCRALMGDAFIEVFMDTPLAVCESRDAKGLYARARAGGLKGFTGIDDPYEAPASPEVRLFDPGVTRLANARAILRALEEKGFLPH